MTCQRCQMFRTEITSFRGGLARRARVAAATGRAGDITKVEQTKATLKRYEADFAEHQRVEHGR